MSAFNWAAGPFAFLRNQSKPPSQQQQPSFWRDGPFSYALNSWFGNRGYSMDPNGPNMGPDAYSMDPNGQSMGPDDQMGPPSPFAVDPNGVDMGPPSEYSMDPNATSMGPSGDLAGNGDGTLSQISDVGGGWQAWQNPGGGSNNFMNDASDSMIADFSAPVYGDFMARLQSKTSKEGTNATAKEE